MARLVLKLGVLSMEHADKRCQLMFTFMPVSGLPKSANGFSVSGAVPIPLMPESKRFYLQNNTIFDLDQTL